MPLADGWGGSMIATEVSDILFGIPTPVKTAVNLGVLKEDHVNIIVHGHNPVVSETIVAACQSPDLLKLAESKGAKGINLAGVCCTGGELMMRHGIPMAGNHLMTELALVTGVVEAMIVDYQCIMPSVGPIGNCYHTKMISTSDKARFPGMEHREFHPETAHEQAYRLVKDAVENFANRNPARVSVPVEPQESYSGFSVEAVIGALGGSAGPLIDAIKAGKIRGAVGIVGCNNPKILHDHGNTVLTKRLIEKDILVVDTGCVGVSNAKAGFKVPEAAELAGPGLKEICKALGIPPVLHFGSCVDNVRILVLVSALANALGCDISVIAHCLITGNQYKRCIIHACNQSIQPGFCHRYVIDSNFRDAEGHRMLQCRIRSISRGVISDKHDCVESSLNAFHHAHRRIGPATDQPGAPVQVFGKNIPGISMRIPHNNIPRSPFKGPFNGSIDFPGHQFPEHGEIVFVPLCLIKMNNSRHTFNIS